MKTIKKVPIEPVFIEKIPELKDMEDGKIYINLKYKFSNHKCLCGCGEEVEMPLSNINIDRVMNEYENKSWGWNIEVRNGKITFSPSIDNYDFSCKSHYIITDNVANFV